MTEQHAQDPEIFYTLTTDADEATRNRSRPITRCMHPSSLNPQRAGRIEADFRRMERQRTETGANTPWGLWTATGGPVKDVIVTQASITAILKESMRT